MKRLKDRLATFGRPLPLRRLKHRRGHHPPYWLVLAIAMFMGVVPVMLGAPPKAAPLTTFEQNIATRCELLYGENARPNLLFLDSPDGVAAVFDRIAPNLAKINANGFGPIVLFKNKLDYVNGGAPNGIPPVDGRLEFIDPEAVKRAAAFLREVGHPFLFYLAPGVCHDPRVGNMTSQEIVDDILRVCKELGFAGVYLDGLTFGDNLEETIAALTRLKGHGIILAANMTIHPNLLPRGYEYGPGSIPGGQVDWAVPRLLQQFTHLMRGEANTVGDTQEEALVILKRFSYVALAPEMIPLYKPIKNSPFDDNKGALGPVLAKLLFGERSSPNVWWSIEPYLKAWKAARAEYRADRDAFVRRVAREW